MLAGGPLPCGERQEHNVLRPPALSLVSGAGVMSLSLVVALTGCRTSSQAAAQAPATPATTFSTSAPASSVAVAPSSPSCSAALTEGEDGTITPLFCPDGSPDPAALAYYEGHNSRGFHAAVLRLASSSTEAQIKSAMCADVGLKGTMGLQTEQQAYALAARRNRWSYDINTVTNLNCP